MPVLASSWLRLATNVRFRAIWAAALTDCFWLARCLSEQRSGNRAGMTSNITIPSGEPRISRTAAA